MKYAAYGPNDPIPEDEQDHPTYPVTPVRPEPVEGRVGTIAATIRSPRLTIPINNRSP